MGSTAAELRHHEPAVAHPVRPQVEHLELTQREQRPHNRREPVAPKVVPTQVDGRRREIVTRGDERAETGDGNVIHPAVGDIDGFDSLFTHEQSDRDRRAVDAAAGARTRMSSPPTVPPTVASAQRAPERGQAFHIFDAVHQAVDIAALGQPHRERINQRQVRQGLCEPGLEGTDVAKVELCEHTVERQERTESLQAGVVQAVLAPVEIPRVSYHGQYGAQ
eukprot:4171411-Prymnesium_polylepis.1